MTAPRHVLLSRPHLAHLVNHPAIERMELSELAALEGFLAFCAQHRVGAPDRADFLAYADLTKAAPGQIGHLTRALTALGVPESILEASNRVAGALENRALFKHVPSAVPRGRVYSVPFGELPDDWRKTIVRLRTRSKYAPDVLDRMSLRLCMFVWSARQRGLQADLGSVEALTALYDDLWERSAGRHDGEPRYAYLRSTFEELCRFASAHGLPSDVVSTLRTTLRTLTDKEARQKPLKFAKVHQIGRAPEIINQGLRMLAEAAERKQPQDRHAGRNAAAALALGIAVPARPGDVAAHHRFGHGIFFEPARGTYRFTYAPTKTRDKISEPLDIELLPDWSPFIDALILHENDPKYLGELRRNAIATQRPLYVNYDGSPCSPRWYSRIWSTHVGTGGHIARTLVYDEMAEHGEFGILYGKSVNHHRSNRIADKYRSKIAFEKNIRQGQSIIERGAPRTDDLSDLLP